MFELYFKGFMTEKQYILENLNACLNLAREAEEKDIEKRIAEIYAASL
jgi:hypothetical protein